MKPVRLMVSALAGVLLALLGVSGVRAGAAPYPPAICAQLAVSTTTPFPGQSITVSGSAFAAHQSVTLILDTSSTVLGHVTASAAGTFSTSARMPTDVRGNHLITVQGDVSGCPVDPVQINVQSGAGSSSSGGGGLAFTGFDAVLAVAVALGLIGAGVLLSRGGKRRYSARH
ncbi:MAG: hypothetical protein JWO57_785 [Pseudonocardiales bacterium]|nr:hypothetical protein [Pseudonocardiales bacterium]